MYENILAALVSGATHLGDHINRGIYIMLIHAIKSEVMSIVHAFQVTTYSVRIQTDLVSIGAIP